MTLTQLAYAVAVDTYRHFGRAAEHCHVSQPTLSMQLQKLEEELGVQLFDRSRKPILPTPIGERILAQARVILRECERLYELLNEDLEAVRGELKLGVIPTLSPYLLPLVTRPLQERYPELTVQVEELTTEQILEALATDRLDAGLIATEEGRPGLRRRALFREPLWRTWAPTIPCWPKRGSIRPSSGSKNSGCFEKGIASGIRCFRCAVAVRRRVRPPSYASRAAIWKRSGCWWIGSAG